MNPIDKIDRSHRQSLVLHGFCLTLFLISLYINYNLTVFAQIVAHYTYAPVELENTKAPLECHYNENSYCWSEPWWWMNERNTAREECKLAMPENKYKIADKEYLLKISNYTYEPPCKLKKTIYVSPLNPLWAVADNRLPGERTLNTLLKMSLLLMAWIGLFAGLSSLILRCRPSEILSALNAETRKMNVLNSLILSYYTAATAQMIQYMYVYTFDPEKMAYHGFLNGGWPVMLGIVIYAIYSPLRYIFLTPLIYFLVSFALPFLYFSLVPLGAALLFFTNDPRISGFLFLILHFLIISALTAFRNKNHTKPTP